jgi:predicted component of type VI protein secretion system
MPWTPIVDSQSQPATHSAMDAMDKAIKATIKPRKEKSPVAEESLEVDDELLLLLSEVPPLDPRPEVVRPPEPAALAATHHPGVGRHGAPVAGAVLLDVGDQHQVLLRRPWPLSSPQPCRSTAAPPSCSPARGGRPVVGGVCVSTRSRSGRRRLACWRRQRR